MDQLQILAASPIGTLLTKLERETGQGIVAIIRQLDRGRCIGRVDLPGHEPDDCSATCEVRVSIRPTCKAGVSRFACQAIIHGLAVGTGFSGVLLKGRLDETLVPAEVRMMSQVNCYNQWEWEAEFAISSSE